MSDDLPMGWDFVNMSDACDVIRGITFPSSAKEIDYNQSNVCCLRTSNIQKEINWNDVYFVSNQYVKREDQIVKTNDILMSMANSYELVGKVAIVSEKPLYRTAFGAFLAAIRTKSKIDSHFMFYVLRSQQTQIELRQGSSQTVNIANISVKTLSTIKVPVPPLNEQRRIVDKLERISDRHRTARNELNHIPKLIARYKQAVLAAAFRGDLTADWRENPEIKNGELWSIPIDWNWKQIKDIAEIASNLVQTSEVMDLPHIAPNHIESGIPRLLPFKTVREDNVISAKHRFFGGQIIYSKIRPYLRKAVIVDFEGVCSADMYPINARCNSKYLLYWLISEDFNNLAVEHQGRTVLPKINQVGLYKLPIPVPSELEQKEIVRRVEEMFEKIDMMEQEYQKAAKLCDRLEQATLAKAFRGELVPQDPDDEPASVLLEQVKRGKEKGKKVRM